VILENNGFKTGKGWPLQSRDVQLTETCDKESWSFGVLLLMGASTKTIEEKV